MPQALERAGMTLADIDLVDMHEAFAAQVIPSAKHLDIPWDKLHVNAGSIALGHPFGMTGARIAVTLLNALDLCDGRCGRARGDGRGGGCR